MKNKFISFAFLILLFTGAFQQIFSDSERILNIVYEPQKVVFDVLSGKKEKLKGLLDRVSLMNKIYESHPEHIIKTSIVVVLHGQSVHLFALKNQKKYKELMDRAQGMTLSGSVEFRMCAARARAEGYEAEDIQNFVKMIPMGDAEIIRLEKEGYAYILGNTD